MGSVIRNSKLRITTFMAFVGSDTDTYCMHFVARQSTFRSTSQYVLHFSEHPPTTSASMSVYSDEYSDIFLGITQFL